MEWWWIAGIVVGGLIGIVGWFGTMISEQLSNRPGVFLPIAFGLVSGSVSLITVAGLCRVFHLLIAGN